MSNHLLLVLRLNPELSTAMSMPLRRIWKVTSLEISRMYDIDIFDIPLAIILCPSSCSTPRHCATNVFDLRHASIPSYVRQKDIFMKTQTATIRGSQHGRPNELRSHGAFAALTALTMDRRISLSKSRFTWLVILGETLFFGFSIPES